MSISAPYDVIVVGAGLSGALVASTLAEEGLRVAVLEARSSVGGTLRRQKGLALLGTPEPFTTLTQRQGAERAQTVWKLAAESLVRLEILLDQMGVFLNKVGSLRLAADAEQSQAFRESVDLLKGYGYAVNLEDSPEYGELVAMSTVDDLMFDVSALVAKLLDHENVALELDAEVHAVKHSSDGGLIIWAHRHYLWADKVILSNGIYAVRLAASLGKALHPMAIHTIALDNERELVRPLLVDSGRICVVPDVEKVYLSGWGYPQDGVFKRLCQVADQLYPDAVVRERFSTWAAVSDDMIPIVGHCPGEPDIYTINGFGPFGLNLALIAADELVDLVLEGQEPGVFALDRLDGGKV